MKDTYNELNNAKTPLKPESAAKPANDASGGGGDDDDDEDATQCPTWPEGTLARIKFLLIAPLLYSFACTVPDCRVARFKKWFPVTFIMSMVWIALLTYVMAWMAEEICKALGARACPCTADEMGSVHVFMRLISTG
eukprot:6171875-Pleurochrysis_carterae.AAC.3